VLVETQLPQKGVYSPHNFRPMSVVAKQLDRDVTWCGDRPQPRRHCVRWGPSSPKKGHSPQFSTHVRCGQTARWIKMPLGMEVGLGPGDCVRWGPSPPPPKKRGTTASQFSARIYYGQTARWIKMPVNREVGLSQATLC